ncbi:hypothetical protein P20480_3491 [Pseudoalteromonas sp. BSi20480]|nr:hypothetical protein P20480_3491 [Pseudoalteromonas sp. BSi20480]
MRTEFSSGLQAICKYSPELTGFKVKLQHFMLGFHRNMAVS